MNTNLRTIFLMALLSFSAPLFAQESAEPIPTDEPTTTEATEIETSESASLEEAELPPRANSYQTRERFNNVLGDYPSDVGRVLSLDPTLLTNEEYLSSYPAIAEFLDSHPEIRNSPQFYLQSYIPRQPQTAADDLLEGMMIIMTMGLAVFGLLWLIRLIIDQRRWSRLSKTQTEVHNKILDRFGKSDELLEYVRTPAGQRFLESAPIPVRAEQESVGAPINRILWSVQLGVVVAVAALGIILVSFGLDEESSRAFFAMGAIGLAVGVGFIVSALVSYLLSERLGLWKEGHDMKSDLAVTPSHPSDVRQ